MKIAVCLLIFCFFISSCASHSREEIVEHNGITVKWYDKGSFVFTDDYQCVDMKRDGRTYNIMESNTGTVENVWINKDTVIIKANPHQHIYYLAGYVHRTYIKIDTSKFR